MTTATLNGTELARSNKCLIVEGRKYFPPDSIRWRFFMKNDNNTICHWKGEADYFNVELEGERFENVAWTYPNPSPAASKIKEHVSFWGDIEVKDI